MSKAERRKRARARARERERAELSARAATVETTTVMPEPVPTGPEPAPAPTATTEALEPESEYITGPIVPRAPARTPTRASVHIDAPLPSDELDDDAEDEDEDEDDEDDEDDDLIDGDEDENDDDDAGDEEDDEEMEEALFNVACSAIEQGDGLSWEEVIHWLCTVEVDDPRLALLVSLQVEKGSDGQPLQLRGERVLKVLSDLGFDDLIEEARETAEPGGGDADADPEERAVVRTSSRELQALAKEQLGDEKPKRDASRPVKASALKARQTALGTTVPAPRRPA